MGPHPIKYRVVTEVSSLENLPKTPILGLEVLFESNNFQKARKECIEWAAWDDIVVHVIGPCETIKFTCDGYDEAETRYPKTVADM